MKPPVAHVWICSSVFRLVTCLALVAIGATVAPSVVSDKDKKVETFAELRHRAESGDVEAQVRLAACLHSGWVGMPADKVEAAKWYRMAAEQGHPEAQNFIGLFYATGSGVPKDEVEAVKWYRKAAEQGVAMAQSSLSLAYSGGTGVTKDDFEALVWNIVATETDATLDVLTKPMRSILVARLGRAASNLAQERSRELLRQIAWRKARLSQGGGQLAESPEPPKMTGTGVFVSNDGVVLTAAHVVESASRVRLLTASGLRDATVLRMDADNDVAVLRCEGAFVAAPVAASESVRVGQSVFTVGFPNIGLQGFQPKLTRGDISSIAGVQDDPRNWQISVPVQPGNSGGGLFDENGNVVGLVVARLSDRAGIRSSGAIPQNINYAVKSAYFTPLLEPFKRGLLEARRTGSFSRFEDAVQEASKSAVLVLVY